MRNLILVIRRFFNFILFILLEIICLYLISNSRSLQGDEIVSSANTVVALIYKKENDLVYYMSLGSMNDSLLNENARLRKVLAQYSSHDTLKDLPVHKSLMPTDTGSHIVKYADYTYLTARVINNSLFAVNNYITINRGSKDGIHKDMSVISGTGLVGRVMFVSGHFASVLSILSQEQPVSAKLKDGTHGFSTWEKEHPEVFVMKDMPQEAKIKKGDSVFTTSFGNVFPPDVLVGTVVKVDINKKNGLQQLSLKPAANFRSLQYIYVVDNAMLPEKKQLEDSSKTKK